ncbi:MAG: CBS domain-containing protein [Gemmatimonadaceae bacterium]|nr:CBS domain-containing protein [Gemmatimonadaceae bacterium]
MGPFAIVLLIVAGVAAMTLASHAVRAVSRIWLRHWVEQRLRGAGLAEAYLEQPQRLQLAAGAGAAAFVIGGGAALALALRNQPTLLVTWLAVAAVGVLIAGVAVPRAIGQRWAVPLAPFLLPLLQLVELLLGVFLLPARALERALRPTIAETPADAEREALEVLLREGEREGVSLPGEREIITGLVAFGDKTLRDVLTPRDQVFALDVGLSNAEQARQIAQSGYSRVPVYRDTLDTVIGMVHIRDVLASEGETPLTLRPVGTASIDRKCSDQLFSMLQHRQHLALVREGDGPILGLVTLEDLLEEVVGDIDDEHDDLQPNQTQS